MYHGFKNKKYAFLIFVRQSIPFSIELNDIDYGYENLKFQFYIMQESSIFSIRWTKYCFTITISPYCQTKKKGKLQFYYFSKSEKGSGHCVVTGDELEILVFLILSIFLRKLPGNCKIKRLLLFSKFYW